MTDHDTPLISVIIPTKDRSALLGQALASAAELARSGLKLELIVVDNGSTDATLTVASSFQARIVRAPVPGAAAARNAGMRAATGDYLAFLDDDDVWLAGHLRPHIDLLEQNPTMAAVVGQVQTADFDLNPIGLPWPAVTAPRQDPFHMFLRQYPQIGATVVRASVRESVGDFDETLVGDEDWDWHLRLALRHDVGFVRTPCVLFRQRPIGVGAEMEWRRLRYFPRVLMRNLALAGHRRPPWRGIARIYLHHVGAYYAFFAANALVSARTGDRRDAWRRLRWAALASPLHASLGLVRPSDFRRAVGAILAIRTRKTYRGGARRQTRPS